jgi:hypothetical protein
VSLYWCRSCGKVSDRQEQCRHGDPSGPTPSRRVEKLPTWHPCHPFAVYLAARGDGARGDGDKCVPGEPCPKRNCDGTILEPDDG